MRLKRGSIRRERGLNIQHRRNDLIFYLHSFGSGSSRCLRLSGNDSYAVAEHQRLVGQHLLICHQQWGRRVARTVEIFLRRFLRQGTAEVAGDLLRLARINAEYLGVGMGAAHQRGIRHVRHSEIICILSESRCLVRGLKARCLTIDNGEFSLLHHACSSFPFAYTSMTSAAATMAASIFV